MDAVTKAFEVADGQLLQNSEFWSQVLSLQESNEACCSCAPNIFALQAVVTQGKHQALYPCGKLRIIKKQSHLLAKPSCMLHLDIVSKYLHDLRIKPLRGHPDNLESPA